MAEQIILLVHGIRDDALWQENIRHVLSRHFTVVSTNYGNFGLLPFLIPIPYFRNRALKRVLITIQDTRKQYRDARISFIAHSFGTYLLAGILKDGFYLETDRIIFCGSVLKRDFPFEQISDRFSTILNEIGTRDVWPAIAESVTWRYGCTGTYGFSNSPRVRDRWHAGAKHGHFLNREFCERYWVPFLKDGVVIDGDPNPSPPTLLVRLISSIKLKYILLALIFFYLCVFYFNLREDLIRKDQIKKDYDIQVFRLLQNSCVPNLPFSITTLAERYEGRTSDHVGSDSAGEIRYGTFRIQAQTVMRFFLGFLRNHYPDPYHLRLKQAGEQPAAIARSPTFVKAWRDLSQAPEFGRIQADFVENEMYRRLADKLAAPRNEEGGLDLDLTKRSLALQAVILSIANQYGSGTALPFDALKKYDDISTVEDREIIEQLYETRDHIGIYSPEIKDENFIALLKERNRHEKADATYMLETSNDLQR